MKFLLLAFCLGLALAAPSTEYPRIQEKSYHAGQEYVYNYDTQVMTGLPDLSTIQAGFRISCHARVQFNTNSNVRVLFDKIVLYRVNEPVVQWRPTERLMPEEFIKELVGEEATTMEAFLQIPFGFQYDNGQVLRVLLDDKETTWSANIKRGFVSLFEMNLEKRFLLDKSFPVFQSPVPPHVNTYNVFERSTTGDCATMYTVTPSQDNDHKYVTKVRDFQQCLTKPIYINTVFDGEWAQDAKKDSALVTGSTIKYSVKTNDKRFIILSAVGESKIVVTPKGKEDIMTAVNQTLYLKDSRQIGHEVSEIPEIHHGHNKRDSIKMTLPPRTVDCQDPFVPCQEEPKDCYEHADVYSVDKIHLHLRMAARNTQEITSEESIAHLRIFKDMLKVSPEAILKKLWEKLNMAKINQQAEIDRMSSEIYWKSLGDVGTTDAAKVVLDICNSEFVMTDKCTLPLSQLALKVTPTNEIIEKLIKLTTHNRLTNDVKMSAYLTLGSFGYRLTRQMEQQVKHCKHSQIMLNDLFKNSRNDRNNLIQKSKKDFEDDCKSVTDIYRQSEEKILQSLRQLLRSSRQDDKILGLKAIGNAGMPNSLQVLKPFLENPVESKILRITAITAHRRIQYPEKERQDAIKSLLKVYLTTTDSNEIRTVAFHTMTGLKPDLSIYETIALSLHREKDSQVSSFVHGFFTALSTSTYHPDWPLSVNCTSALKFSPGLHGGLDHSFFKRFGYFSEYYKRGAALTVTKIGDFTRYLDNSLRLDSSVFGFISQIMEVGIHAEGLSPFFNKLIGPRGLLTNNKSLFDLLKRGPRDISPEQMIQQILKTLNVKTRSMPTPYGHLYVKFFGHEVGYYDFTSLLRSATILGSVPITWNVEGLGVKLPVNLNTMYDLIDHQITLPTEAGLPISLKLQLMSTAKVTGSLSFKVAPYMTEEDRQGEPPIGLHSSIDLKPIVAVEVQGSMGLDMFYMKPKVGIRGLVKYNAPIQDDIKIDLAYRRLNLKWHTPVMEKPVVEMILEPFSEFMMITKQSDSPVFIDSRKHVYTPVGTRVMPLGLKYNLNSIGYQLALTGQVPHCLSKTDPMRPFHGRTLLNVFFKPMENAPSAVDFYIQDIYPIRDAVTNSNAQTFQEVLTNGPEQYGSSFSNMQKSGVMNFENGHPLPQSTEEILPYSDPVNTNTKTPVNMQQMCNKFQRIFGKPMPFYNEENARAVVLLVDASTRSIHRFAQLETLVGYFKEGQIKNLYSRFWRSALPDYDTEDWQLLSEFGVTYPLEVKEPRDILDPKWQRQLMKDLEHLISLESHKIVNQRMNMTILSNLEQFNYPAMIRTPTYRILESLVPEQVCNLMNISGSTIYNTDWANYWQSLAPVYRQVEEQVRINVDPSFVKRDLPLNDYLTQVLKVQSSFLRDLNDVISKTVVAQSEMAIIQWINYIQSRTVYMIKEIFYKDVVKDLIQEPDQIKTLLTKAEINLDSIVSLLSQLMERVTAVSQELDTEGRPVVVFRPEVLRRVTKPNNIMYAFEESTTENKEHLAKQNQLDTVNSLRMSLYNLSMTQVQMIEKIQLAISNKREFNLKYITLMTEEVRENLNILDSMIKMEPIIDPVTKQTLLLVTVQNEICIELLEQWKKNCVESLHIKPSVDTMHLMTSNMMLMKEQGVYLGERVSMLYHMSLMSRVVVPNLNRHEYPIYKEIVEIKRTMIPEIREFELQLVYNFTNMRKPEVFVATCDRFCERLTTHVTKIAEIEKSLINLGQIPKVYLVSELMDALNYLKYTTEFGSRTLYSVNDQNRFVYLEKLSSMATKVQTLVSGLSPIFNKYVQKNEPELESRTPILNTMSINTHVLDVQDVIVQQEMLEEQMRRFVQNPEVSVDVLDQVLNVFVDRCQVLQETLKQNQIQVESALKQQKLFEKQTISAFWTRALNQQRSLYEALLTVFNNKRDQLSNVVHMKEEIKALQMEIAQLAGSHEETMDNMMNNNVDMMSGYGNYPDTYVTQPLNDQPSWQAQKNPQPLTTSYLPTGVTALLNFTWGGGRAVNKNAKVQLMATRSVEQIMYLFKQMSAVLRSEDIVYAINRGLSDVPWLAHDVMQKLNSFNHWHFIAEAQKEHMSQWLLDQLQYAQDFFKSTYWNEFNRQPGVDFVSDNQVHAMIDISDRNKEWDFYLLKNSESDVFQGIKMFKWLQNFAMIQNYRPFEDKVMSYLTFDDKPTQCHVKSDKVYTFDKVNYQLPTIMGKKEALLAADCSDDKAFAITMVKSNTSFNGHIVKIISLDKVVEIIPGYLDVQVKVNGKEIALDDSKPVSFSKKLHYNMYSPNLKIVTKGDSLEVTFPITGLSFMMEGTHIQIQVSELYKRRLCGLCSNFDTQISWEYEGPSQEVYTSPKTFAQSYILREQDRPVFRPNKQEFTVQHDKYYNIVSHYKPKGGAGHYEDDNESSDKEEQKQPSTDNDNENVWKPVFTAHCKPIDSTLVQRRTVFGQMCFSKTTVRKCPNNCPVIFKAKTQEIKFICISLKDPKVGHLTGLASFGPVQHISKVRGEDITREIKHAEECQEEY